MRPSIRRNTACAAFVTLLSLLTPIRSSAQERKEEPAPRPSALLTLSVVDAAGQPLPQAQACLIENTYNLPLSKAWTSADERGGVRIASEHVDPSLLGEGETAALLVVRAAGHAWTTRKLTLPVAEPQEIRMAAGRAVEITVKPTEGAKLPADLLPIVFTQGLSVAAWVKNVQYASAAAGKLEALFHPSMPEQVELGRYRVRVPDDCQSLWVLVHHAGFLRCFQAGPFDRASIERGRIDLALPAPSALTVQIAPHAERPHEYAACGYELMLSPEIPDGGWSFQAQLGFAEGRTLEVTLADLAPATYHVTALTGDARTSRVRDRADYYRVQNAVELSAGAPSTVALALQTFDEAWWRKRLKGEHTLTVQVANADGSPAAGRAYTLAFRLQQFGRDLTIQQGEIPADGTVAAAGLPASDQDAWLAVLVEGKELGTIYIDSKDSAAKAEFRMAPHVGELAPDITLTRLKDGSAFPLSSLRGQIVMLDFWASWCGPCQEPMAHGHALAKKRSDYAGKVTLIGASIDDKIETIREHLRPRGWEAVLQTFCGEGEPGWKSTAAKTYALTSVPTAFLIDKDGRITWTGNPHDIDLEKEIDALLKR